MKLAKALGQVFQGSVAIRGSSCPERKKRPNRRTDDPLAKRLFFQARSQPAIDCQLGVHVGGCCNAGRSARASNTSTTVISSTVTCYLAQAVRVFSQRYGGGMRRVGPRRSLNFYSIHRFPPDVGFDRFPSKAMDWSFKTSLPWPVTFWAGQGVRIWQKSGVDPK